MLLPYIIDNTFHHMHLLYIQSINFKTDRESYVYQLSELRVCDFPLLVLPKVKCYKFTVKFEGNFSI